MSKLSKNNPFRWIIFGLIVAYLIYRLSQLGWAEIAQFIPTSPLFYGLTIFTFLVPIMAERAAFKWVAKNKIKLPFKAFMRKYVLNKAVLTYSGEAYFIKLLTETHLPLKKASVIIKDLALIRTFTANLWVIILVLLTLFLGNRQTLIDIAVSAPKVGLALGVMTLGICILFVVFFRKLSSVTYSVAAKASGVFLLRSVIVGLVLIAQWSLAIPGTALSVWCTFLVVFVLSRKFPVGGEIMFVSIALTLPGLHDDIAAVAAMLMTIFALNQISYLIGFLLTVQWPARRAQHGFAAKAEG